MANISDMIEEFLLRSLEDESSLNINRGELARFFEVAPSQINYVLMTRFTSERGFATQSRRGGGGSITVFKLAQSPPDLLTELCSIPVADGISYKKAKQVLQRLESEKIISDREKNLLCAAISDRALISPLISKDCMRAGILKEIVCELLKNNNT